MDNVFDGLQDAAFDMVADTMGYTATWQPSAGGDEQSGRVLFKNPTEGKKLGDIEYDPFRYTMEYKETVFPGLKSSVDGGENETVSIQGNDYFVKKVDTKFDGKTFIATLQSKTS